MISEHFDPLSPPNPPLLEQFLPLSGPYRSNGRADPLPEQFLPLSPPTPPLREQFLPLTGPC